MGLRRSFDFFILAIFSVCGALLVARAAAGPFRVVHSPVNLEGFTAAAFLVMLIGKAAPVAVDSSEQTNVWLPRWPLALVAAVTVVTFLQSLSIPFVADDYSHIWNARHATQEKLLAHFTQPEPDRFFRPLVYVSYAVEARFAGLNPEAWRAVGLLWHTANSVIVYLLLRRFRLPVLAAATGAIMFAVHGTCPEAVTWVAARFDLMATGFGLAALLLLTGAELDAPRRKSRYALSLLLLFAALLCKESALVFPVLAVASLRYLTAPWKRVLRLCAGWFAVAGAVFLWRWTVLGGIGGYTNATDGHPTIYSVRWTSTLKGLFLRSWGVSFFPINWTHAPEWWLTASMVAAMTAMAWVAWRPAPRRTVLCGFALFFIAALPVHQFLSIGADLEKSRVLYLPGLGFAMLVAALFTQQHRWNALAAIGLIVFQIAALTHNLREWRAVGELAQTTCNSITAQADAGVRPLAVPDLPNTLDGVYFLKTGFPQCVWLPRPDLEPLVRAKPIAGDTVLHWDPNTRTAH